jgi:predicted kinase
MMLAKRSTEPTGCGIVITRGPTGSGKTTRTQALVELAGAIRIRTDVERKRLHGLAPQARCGAALNEGLYSEAETQRTYSHVARLTLTVVHAGYPVIVDGTFLSRRRREQFRALAAGLEVPFVIADFVAPTDALLRRVDERRAEGRDASDADIRVLTQQLEIAEPIGAGERDLTVTLDAGAPIERSSQVDSWQLVLDRLHVDAAVQ